MAFTSPRRTSTIMGRSLLTRITVRRPASCRWSSSRSGTRIPERVSHVILGERGSRCCILNGAVARTCQPGDQIIICNSVYLDESRLTSLKPKVLTFDESNHVQDRLSYSVGIDASGKYTFEILDEAETALPIPLMVSGS